jgi:hypothetical protein
MSTATARPASPVRRLLPWVGTEWKRLSLAVFLGAMAIACGVGLLAVSAWLISRAALQPPILELEVAIVAVRAFGIGKGFFRYTERIVSHDAACALSRLWLAGRLAVVAPAGVLRTAAATCSSARPRRGTQTCRCGCSTVRVRSAGGARLGGALAPHPPGGRPVPRVAGARPTVVPWIAARAAADADRASAPARALQRRRADMPTARPT